MSPRPRYSRYLRYSRSSWSVIALAGLVGFVGAVCVSFLEGVPRPAYHDEWSYLLAAETFTAGRLANPPSPHGAHFETYHVLQRPTYASKYPPGQGLLLALGLVTGGHPIVGVFFGVLLLGAALGYMLSAFLPWRWALLGALLGVAQVGFFTYWGRSYWGGALAAACAALVFGATARIVRRGRVRDALWLVLGLAVLSQTRPFEGAVVSLVAAWPLARWLFGGGSGGERPRRGRLLRARLARIALPVAAGLALLVAWMALYNRAVTGDPVVMPYAVYEARYGSVPLFVWQAMPEIPDYRHERMQRFYVDGLRRTYEEQRDAMSWLAACGARLAKTWRTLLGPVWTLPWLLVPWTWRRRGVRLAVFGTLVYVVASSLVTYHHSHYAAPVYPLLLLPSLHGLRHAALWLSWRHSRHHSRHHSWHHSPHHSRGRARRLGRLLVILWSVAVLGERALFVDPVLEVGRARASSAARPEITAHLEKLGGRHLVFVRYGPAADPHDEWIANRADLEAAEIVWAASLGSARDQALCADFTQRRVWTVELGFAGRGSIGLERGPPP